MSLKSYCKKFTVLTLEFWLDFLLKKMAKEAARCKTKLKIPVKMRLLLAFTGSFRYATGYFPKHM
jgi:hypothetical protein